MRNRDQDLHFMRRALALARRGEGKTSPNPMVGAVVVRGERVVGEGYHVYRLKDHAEVVALEQAGTAARGATLYVTLEPCCFHGRTPPCTRRIIQSGIRRVVVATEDPNPKVCGRGIQELRGHGIDVEVGLCRDQAEQLNEAFFLFITTGRPFVLLKLAMTLDGKIGLPGRQMWITGEAARREVHRLRYRCDAILVGVNTVLTDNPSLDVRWIRRNSITKVVLDSNLRTPPEARLFSGSDPVIIFHHRQAPLERIRALQSKATLIPVGRGDGGLDWGEVLNQLGSRQVVNLMIEGGAAVASSALRSRVVQKVRFFYAPAVLGCAGISAFSGSLSRHRPPGLRLDRVRIWRHGEDFSLEGYLPQGPSEDSKTESSSVPHSDRE